jgi:hypothetical protein
MAESLTKKLQRKQIRKDNARKARQVLQTIVGPRTNLGGTTLKSINVKKIGTTRRLGQNSIDFSSEVKNRKGTKRNPQTARNSPTYMRSTGVGAAEALKAQKRRNDAAKRKRRGI